MAFVPSKFLHLKYLSISIAVAYDYLSLVYFLDAAPSLETFKLCVLTGLGPTDKLLLEDRSQLRQMSGYCHHKLQTVKISRCSGDRSTRCSCLVRPWEDDEAVLVIEKYIKGKVPSTVKLMLWSHAASVMTFY
uniref:At1g61320/AtMIF1 LRR domain-containing protein n=2 Tax=Aegilops tauschii subsp. strangulata TaxID=200361 RepID=A0A453L9Q4_AEGTS